MIRRLLALPTRWLKRRGPRDDDSAALAAQARAKAEERRARAEAEASVNSRDVPSSGSGGPFGL